jgi:hypothetical protein
VEHQFAKPGVKCRPQPAPRALFQRVRPEHHGVALVVIPFKSRKLSFVRRSHGVCMKTGPKFVKNSVCSVAADVRRRLANPGTPPPHVGGYDSV